MAVLVNLEESVIQREKIKEILVVKLEENDSYLKRMREVISSLREDRNLFSPNLPASFIKLNLLQSLQASKLQLSEATDLLDRIYEAEIHVHSSNRYVFNHQLLKTVIWNVSLGSCTFYSVGEKGDFG